MKIYIAASLKNQEVNNVLKALKDNNLDFFNPALLGLNEEIEEERNIIFKKCLFEIEYDCDILLAIAPYGESVSGEVGYAGCLKLHNNNKLLLLYNSGDESPCKEENEAIQAPFFDKVFDDLNKLIQFLVNYRITIYE